jgi:hypothetical protein
MNDHHPHIEFINFESFSEEQINAYLNFPNEDCYIDRYNNFSYLDKLLPELGQGHYPSTPIQSNATACQSESTSTGYTNETLSIVVPCEFTQAGLMVPSGSVALTFDNCRDLKDSKRKTFDCPVKGCAKVYKSKENLTLHYKNIHLKEKPYSCKFCEAVFSHRNGKTYHERRFHTKYFPHKCSFIGIFC